MTESKKFSNNERINLLEQMLIDRCDEISEISFAIVSMADGDRRARHEKRLSELRYQMQVLWRTYSQLVPTHTRDLEF